MNRAVYKAAFDIGFKQGYNDMVKEAALPGRGTLQRRMGAAALKRLRNAKSAWWLRTSIPSFIDPIHKQMDVTQEFRNSPEFRKLVEGRKQSIKKFVENKEW